MLAAFAATSTLLFFIYGSRPGITAKRFLLVHLLWHVLTFVRGFAFVMWITLAALQTGEAISRMLILLFLGLLSPVFGTFGLVAWAWPNTWQRFILARDAGQQYYRGRSRRALGRPAA